MERSGIREAHLPGLRSPFLVGTSSGTDRKISRTKAASEVWWLHPTLAVGPTEKVCQTGTGSNEGIVLRFRIVRPSKEHFLIEFASLDTTSLLRVVRLEKLEISPLVLSALLNDGCDDFQLISL